MNDSMNIDRFLPSLSQDKLISDLLYGSDSPVKTARYLDK